MRYMTHHFAHVETMQRARRWLVELGFDSTRIHTHGEHHPWMTILDTADRLAQARVIINAIEHGEHGKRHGVWDRPRDADHVEHHHGAHVHVHAHEHHESVTIGWHPPDSPAAR